MYLIIAERCRIARFVGGSGAGAALGPGVRVKTIEMDWLGEDDGNECMFGAMSRAWWKRRQGRV